MEYLIAIVSSGASEIGKSLAISIKRHIGYLVYYNRNITNLQDERKKLDDKMVEADQFVQDANRKFKVPIPSVPRWKEEADKLNQKVGEFFEKETPGASNRCLNGRCQYPWSRYSSSRKASKMTEDIREKIRDAPDFGIVAYDAPQPNLGSTFNLEGVKDFESRLSVMNDVWEALKNDELSMIGICGMAGVGKTTLVKKLVKRIETENLFGVVAMTVVSQNPNSTIQDVIIERFSLQFEEKTLVGRASKLHEWIMKCDKRVLLILDDVWEKVDFEAIGLPLNGDRKGYKIVLTSRRDDLCTKIGSQKNFLIDILKEEEARGLFKVTVGNSIEGNLVGIACEIADRCGGLPIAIVALAKALKSKPKHRWDDALLQLKTSNMKGILEMGEVDSRLKLSIDLLESDQAKALLFLCCLFPEDYSVPVEHLVGHGIGLGWFQNVQFLYQARDRVRTLIDELKESFLLLEGDSDEYESVKMHDLIRDVAIVIAKDNSGYLVCCNSNMKSWPAEMDRYKNFTAISLVRIKIDEHLVDLECPKLQLLQLWCENDSQPLPNNSFGGMKELKVLSLEIPLLPQPLDVLKKLRTLHLYRLKYGEISAIGALITLEILRIETDWDSYLKELPIEIGRLRNLRVLNLSSMSSLRYIPLGVLSKMSNLEELYVSTKFMAWGLIEDGKENASLKELESHPITALEIYVFNFLVFPKEWVISNLSRFKVVIGTHFKYNSYGKDSMNELYIEGDGNDVLASGFSALLRNTEVLGLKVNNLKNCLLELEDEGSEETSQLRNKDLCFYKLKDVRIFESHEMKYVFPLSMARGLKQLQSINIKYCDEIEGIFYGKEEDDEKIISKDDDSDIEFPQLKMLYLYNLPKLIGFWIHKDKVLSDISKQSSASHINEKTRIGPSLFSSHRLQLPNLQELNLRDCGLLKVVFSTSIAGQLMQLKKLTLRRCKRIEYVVAGGEEDHKRKTKIVFPMLMSIYFSELPELVAFYPDGHTSFGSLNELKVRNCPKMKTFPSIYPSVDSTVQWQSSNQQLQSSQEPTEVSLLKNKFTSSHNYDHTGTCCAFSFKSIEALRNLNKLALFKNDEFEVIFSFEEWRSDGVMLSVLEKLELSFLPKLAHIWFKIPPEITAFQNLKELDVYDCSSLKYIFSPCAIKLLVRLEKVIVDECHGIEAIVAEEEEEEEEEESHRNIIFPQLRFLQLTSLTKLKSFCSDRSTTVEFPLLEDLRLKNVGAMMEEKVQYQNKGEFGHSYSHAETCPPFTIRSIKRIRNLKRLEVGSCQSLEVIYLFEENHADGVLFNNLEELRLDFLPNFKHVLLKIPPEISAFQNLKKINIEYCDHLKYLFSPPVAKLLVKLEVVRIIECKMVEAMVAEEKLEAEARSDRIVFPRLRFLELQSLHKFKSFCIENSVTVELPLLEDLKLVHCHQIRTFSYGSVITPKLKTMRIDSRYYQLEKDLNTTLLEMCSKRGKDAMDANIVDVAGPFKHEVDVKSK
ncbi:probable disease resistance protein At1g61190 [Ricinus communis]|uniref:Disease resistance protein RFL1, putative n=1 Tax=Ricinus communis TaxID=3988 RepID=B9S720_RICCO|nr:probable disease resistance protein At1g61190 [Ricinus communis]EEF40599.1 Disease resistance protein RFL1, putative [Ricinus communis]|eukprot:XP_002521789.3 probable disease resistance protein At1g61190 [Ricinus communis]